MAEYEIKEGVGIIPAGSTEIKDDAFIGCKELKSVIIPDSVTKIGNSAFRWCSALTEINIPDSVTEIGGGAFVGCISLKNLVLPDSVTKIGYDAFQACINLTGIVISESVISIGSGAFSSIRDLTSITVAAGNKVYDSRDNCNGIIETKTNTLIAGCKNTVIPATVTRIGSKAFLGCCGLADLVIPESVTEIGNCAFFGAKLTSVVISGKVEEIGEWAFRDCPELTDVVIGDHVKKIGDYAFVGCAKLTHLVIGNSVVKIGESAFSGCSSLKSVIIPESVKVIYEHAFSGCSNLTEVHLGNYEMYGWVYYDCPALKSITFHESCTKIPSTAFQKCPGLTEVIIPDSVTLIGYGAFKGCTGLTHVVIPDSVTKIGSEAFYYCTNLSDVIIPDSVTEIGSMAFMKCEKLSDVIIPNSVTKIGDRAFWDCTGLTSVIIPNSVTEIEEYSFCGCTSLENIVIPNSVTEIGSYAFKGCTSLNTITLPESVTDISFYGSPFEDCTALKTIFVPANKYGHFKKLLPKDFHEFIVRLPKPKKPKKKPGETKEDRSLPESGLSFDLENNKNECVTHDNEVQLITPLTENDVVLNHKKEALEKLLDNCQAEFCYRDPRVEKYKKDYLILGEENIATIYKVYMHWLRMNCSTELQEGSDDFVGVAIDWRGRKDLQPTFDVSGDVVVVKNDHPNAGNPITNAKEFLEATSGERNEYLMAHFAKVFPQAHIDKIVCVLNDGDEIFYDLYTDGMKSAVTVIIEHGELDIVSTLELVMKSKNTTYEEMLEKHNSKNK